MVELLINNSADFVKGKFHRAAGRVAALTAKPLLKTFFPELFEFEQPLGGIIAAKRVFLKKIRFENDYGVDIGVLIDVYQLGARVKEVAIGYFDHDHQSLESISKMSYQIVRTILERAAKCRKLHPTHIGESCEIERVAGVQYCSLLQKIQQEKPLVLFDMDGILLDVSFVEYLAHYVGRRSELKGLLGNQQLDPVYRTEMMAKVLAGVPKYKFENIAKVIPLKPQAQETVIALRQRGFQVGVITDSYFFASEIVRKRVFADFAVAHLLQFKKGLATGEIIISPFMKLEEGCKDHRLCKSNFLHHLKTSSDPSALKISSIGNGENDICLFRNSRLSFSVYPQSIHVKNTAFKNLDSLIEVIDHV
jgi:glucosyl-3-phosphoglycerate synthase